MAFRVFEIEIIFIVKLQSIYVSTPLFEDLSETWWPCLSHPFLIRESTKVHHVSFEPCFDYFNFIRIILDL